MPDSDIHPLAPARLADMQALFETDSIARNCWCMHWRMAAKDWKTVRPPERRAAFAERVRTGDGADLPPGLLAYRDGAPIGWVQICPRAEVPRFNSARTAKPDPGADLGRVWALSCFFIAAPARGQGLMEALARAACAHAAAHGATAVEAAAIRPRRDLTWGEGFVGIASALARAGFETVEERGEVRSFMRWRPDPA